MLVRKSAARKQPGEALASAPKVGLKVAQKRKSNAKDGRLSKKVMGLSIRDQQQKSPSPLPPPHHGVGKGLMIGKGLFALDPVQRLVTHKDYAFEMVNSIIKETDLDPCGEHFSEDLGASGLYDLSRVCLRHL